MKIILSKSLVIFVFFCLILLFAGENLAAEERNDIKLNPQSTELLKLGQRLYAEHCASCHGKNLKVSQIGDSPNQMVGCQLHRTMSPDIPGIIPIRYSLR